MHVFHCIRCLAPESKTMLYFCELMQTDCCLRAHELGCTCSLEMCSRCCVQADDFIDIIEGNRKFLKCIYVYNKVDMLTLKEIDSIARRCAPRFQVYVQLCIHAFLHARAHFYLYMFYVYFPFSILKICLFLRIFTNPCGSQCKYVVIRHFAFLYACIMSLFVSINAHVYVYMYMYI